MLWHIDTKLCMCHLLVESVKGVVHFKKKKTFADNLLTPQVIQDVNVFLSSVEKKLRFLI